MKHIRDIWWAPIVNKIADYIFIVIYANVTHSNRYMEKALYQLPVQPCEDHDAGLEDEMGLTEAEVLYMVSNQTLELPRNFFRRLIKKSSQFETLQYVGFNVRDKFPNNIVRVKDGRIMYVTHIETDYEEDPSTGGELNKPMHLVHGFYFKKVYINIESYLCVVQ